MNTSSKKSPLQQSKGRERLATFLWVSFVTAIIWIWADLEQTRTETVRVAIAVSAPAESDILIQQPAAEGVRVSFVCRGAQSRIEKFMREAAEKAASGQPLKCVYPARADWQSGDYLLNTNEILSNWDRLRDAGLSAESASPATITVKVDRWVNATAKVVLRTNNDLALVSRSVEPEQVKIRVAASDFELIKDKLTVYTDQIDLASLPVGEDISRTISLKSGIDGHPVEFVDSSEVTAKLHIGRRTITRTLKVPVKLIAKPELLEQAQREGFVLKRKDTSHDGEWLLELTVSGERKDIEKLLSDTDAQSNIATAPISASDFEKTDIYPDRAVIITLPPGIELISPTEPKVHFKFDRF